MSERAIRVLLIDDDEDDFVIARDLFAEIGGPRYEITWVNRSADALAALTRGQHDVCLLDYRLDGPTGLEILAEAQAAGCAVPVIMLTGLGDHDIDLAAMNAGAADYLVKGELEPRVLERSIRYAISHKKSQVELLRLNEEKNRFLGMAAHDLRNPLGVILGYSDFLLMCHGCPAEGLGDAVPTARWTRSELEVVDRIRSSSRFMLHLINDLLDISTIESGKLRLDMQSTDLIQLVQGNVGLNTVLAAQKGMQIELQCDPDVPRAPVDSLKVEQVLNNLISNAIHYAPKGTTITVRVRQQGDEVVISVQDQGPGIAREEIGNLFRPFGRARTVSTGGEPSTGLGLAIARRIVEGHDGRIWVESELGRGATFSVSFPVRA